MVTAKKYILVKRFEGVPKASDVRIVEEELPLLKENEYLCKAEYWSVDPYIRKYMDRYPLNSTVIGRQVARIVESKNPNFPSGKLVFAAFGWRDYTIAGGTDENPEYLPILLSDEFADFPSSLALGVLGRPGNSAYFGFLELCNPKENETVVVTGAAGAVGSIVGQIAKIKGCKVIGFAGSDEKCEWLSKELGFDHAFNYKTVDAATELKKVAPEGIDCFFDNVGGELSSTIINQMNKFGRISICGSISSYNNIDGETIKASIIQPKFVSFELKMEGFLVNRWTERFEEGIKQNMEWIKQGKLKYRETVSNGFENIFNAFVDMLQGGNIGKAIIKA